MPVHSLYGQIQRTRSLINALLHPRNGHFLIVDQMQPRLLTFPVLDNFTWF